MHKRLESSIEEYLEEVTQQLGSLPAERREEELREMRQHLDETVVNSRKQGLSEEQAVAAALTRFGTPKEAAESVIWAWRHHVRKVWILLSVQLLSMWSALNIFKGFQIFSSIPYPIRDKLLVFEWGMGAFICFLPLLLALSLYLPRKYQPAWVYRLLAKSGLAKIR